MPLLSRKVAYSLSSHNLAITALSTQIRAFHTTSTPFRIDHGSTNSMRIHSSTTPTLNISHLSHILSLTPTLAIVEPNVPLDALVATALATKPPCVPPVVMEFPGITVGGGFSGASGESSSWRYGTFDCCVSAVEIILADGEVVRAEKGGINAELFNAARCSLGSMGVVTLLEVRLVRAREFVEVKYWPMESVGECVERLGRVCAGGKVGEGEEQLDFVEAILFAADKGVMITGRMVDKHDENKKLSISRFDRAWDEWFYRHAAQVSQADGVGPGMLAHTELVPLQSYLFRYDRGAFWTGAALFQDMKVPFVNIHILEIPITALTRTLLNPLLTTRAVYKAMHKIGGGPGSNIVQDLLLPINNAESFVKYVEDELAIWPIWVCPMAKSSSEGSVCCWPFWKKGLIAEQDEMLLNFGVWGPGHQDPVRFKHMNRRMEEKLRELHGMKVLYAEAFYTEEEFWQLYDRKEYERLREKYRAGTLPTIWEKIERKVADRNDEQDDESRGRSVSPKKSSSPSKSASPGKKASPCKR